MSIFHIYYKFVPMYKNISNLYNLGGIGDLLA